MNPSRDGRSTPRGASVGIRPNCAQRIMRRTIEFPQVSGTKLSQSLRRASPAPFGQSVAPHGQAEA